MNRDKWPHWHRGYSLRYAPIKAINYWFDNLRAFFRRGRMGWSYGDAWDIDTYLGIVIPGLLRHLAEHGIGCPMGYIEEYKDDEDAAHEAWHNDLKHTAELIEFAMSDSDDHNEYAKAYWDIALNKPINDPMPEGKEWLQKAYYDERKKISEKQQAAIEEAMTWLGKNWFDAWD